MDPKQVLGEIIVVEIIVMQIQVEMFLTPYVDIMMAASDVAFAGACASEAICNRCPFWVHLLRSAQGLQSMKGQAKCAKAICRKLLWATWATWGCLMLPLITGNPDS